MDRHLICIGLFSIGLLLQLSSNAPGQEATKLAWPDIISGIRFERERLHSGIYTATGTESVAGIEGDWPVRLYSVFSFPDKSLRFEHRGAQPIVRKGQSTVQDTFRCIHVAPDRTEHYTSLASSKMLNIVAPGTMRVKGRAGTRGYLDPRCLGLIQIHKIYDGLTFDKVGPDWSAKMSAKAVELSEDQDGIVRATIQEGGARDSYWIDTRQGFTLIRHLKEAGMLDRETGEFNRLSQAIEKNDEFRNRIEEAGIDWRARSALDVPEEVDISWKQIGDVWVPTSYKHVTVTQEMKNVETPTVATMTRREVTLSFDWSEANAPIDRRLFDYHDFNLPIGTEVFDQRGNEPEFLEKIGSLPAAVSGATVRPWTWRRWLVIGINSAGVLVVLTAFMFRRRSASTRTTSEVSPRSSSAAPGG